MTFTGTTCFLSCDFLKEWETAKIIAFSFPEILLLHHSLSVVNVLYLDEPLLQLIHLVCFCVLLIWDVYVLLRAVIEVCHICRLTFWHVSFSRLSLDIFTAFTWDPIRHHRQCVMLFRFLSEYRWPTSALAGLKHCSVSFAFICDVHLLLLKLFFFSVCQHIVYMLSAIFYRLSIRLSHIGSVKNSWKLGLYYFHHTVASSFCGVSFIQKF